VSGSSKEDHFGEEFDTQVEIETGKREKSVTEVLCEKIETIETGKRKKSVSEVLLEKEYGIRSTD
jgi:ribosomal protein S9